MRHAPSKAKIAVLALVCVAMMLTSAIWFIVGWRELLHIPVGALTDGPELPAMNMPTGALMPRSRIVADMPLGFIGFCIRLPLQCERQPNETIRIVMTAAIWTTLRNVNTAVNDAIWPESDERHYKRAEYWTIPTEGYGDCEDYALTKKRDLMAAGLPESALRLAIVDAGPNGRHMVLTVAADNGDYVLDNLRRDIVTWNKTGYIWLVRQNPNQPLGWLQLSPPGPRSGGPTSGTCARAPA
jgi:predicted transglutaminase-like cysteine proteinase